MNSVKKMLAVFLSAVMLVSTLSAFAVSAYAINNSGSCGENVTYTFDAQTGTLIISGEGNMTDFKNERETPVIPIGGGSSSQTEKESSPFKHAAEIKNVVIKDDVTSIGMCAFFKCKNLKTVILSVDVAKIGYAAFDGCDSLNEILYPGSETQFNAITVGDDNDAFNTAPKQFNTACPHIWHTYTTPATCTVAGEERKVCLVCGAPQQPTPIKPTGHSYKSAVTYQNANIYVLTYTCLSCKDKYTKTMNKAANTLTVKAKKPTVKLKKLKKKNQTIAAKNAMTISKARGTVTYALSSAKKGKKNFKKYFAVDKKTGKITVKKKLAKGTYKVAIKVNASGNTYYKAGAKTVTVKITVK